MRNIIFSFIVMIFGSLSLKAQERQQIYYTNLKALKRFASSDSIQFTYTVYQLPNQTYGYVIFADGEKYLHQCNMPGKDLNTGFRSKADAEKVAKLILLKLKYPVAPPTVNTEEMQQLGIN